MVELLSRCAWDTAPRRPSHLRVQSIEILAHSRQYRAQHLPYSTQRMIRWNPIFQRHVAEHPRLQLLIVSSHPYFLSQLYCGIAVVLQQPHRRGGFTSAEDVGPEKNVLQVGVRNQASSGKPRCCTETGQPTKPVTMTTATGSHIPNAPALCNHLLMSRPTTFIMVTKTNAAIKNQI